MDRFRWVSLNRSGWVSFAVPSTAKLEIAHHYNSIADSIELSIKRYYEQLQHSREAHGKNLYGSGFALKLKLALFKKFSKKLSELVRARSDLRSSYKDVVRSFNNNGYFEEKEQIENVHEPANFETAVESLQVKLEDWRHSFEPRVKQHLNGLNGSSLPPSLTALAKTVEDIISSCGSLMNTCKRELLLTELDPEANTISEVLLLIPKIQGYAQELSHGITAFRTEYKERLQLIATLRSQVDELVDVWNKAGCFTSKLPTPSDLEGVAHVIDTSTEISDKFKSSAASFRDWFSWKQFWLRCSERDKAVISVMLQGKVREDWSTAFTNWYWRTALTKADTYALPDSDAHIDSFKETSGRLSLQQQAAIIHKWKFRQKDAVWNFTAGNTISVSQLYNLRGRNGERRNSLKQIISRDFELFTSFFPVVMVSPDTASSILPLKEGLFDLVLFDEASQLRLEDTFTSLLRGQIKIVAGDKHQMPPSNAFQSTADTILLDAEEDENDREEQQEESNSTDQRALDRSADIALADSESLLTFAEETGYERSYLKVHYRSEHPALIEFSNSAFYGRRLLPMPERFEYTPIRYVQVDGTYSEQTNRDEARQVISILANNIKPLPDGKYPTVMVATFNIQQRELIRELIDQRKAEDPAFLSLITNLGVSFEVKNLENIQGDERDIFIISTTFGRKSNGKFSQVLGPISQGKGHRMLNVLVTRAKKQLFLCTSVPAEIISRYATYIQVKGNIGNGIFYAYLAYARTISSGDKQGASAILDILDRHCTDKELDPAIGQRQEIGLSESAFEEEVYQRLVTAIGTERVEQQHTVGGFRIDMIVKPLNPYGQTLAIECDGAKYHSSREAYAHDIFRQDQLEKMGFVFHRIWSSRWWRDAAGETSKLIDAIKSNDIRQATADLFFTEKGQGLFDTEIELVNEPLPVSELLEVDVFAEIVMEPTANNRTISGPTSKRPKSVQANEAPTLFDEVTVATRKSKSVLKGSTVTVRYENGIEKRIRFSSTKSSSSSQSEITVVKVDSPVAVALLGKKVGDVCQLPKMTVKVIDVE